MRRTFPEPPNYEKPGPKFIKINTNYFGQGSMEFKPNMPLVGTCKIKFTFKWNMLSFSVEFSTLVNIRVKGRGRYLKQLKLNFF